MFLKIYIIPIMLMSPFMMISCNSWFSIWLIMELNLMSFIPLIIYNNKYFKELSMKYFIIQTISSSIFLLSTNSLMINSNNYLMNMQLMINLTLLMKLGMPPFHMWFISLMNNMNWLNCLIISTWQKIIPMIIFMYIYMETILMIFIMYSITLSSIMALNHQSIRIILSYSSIIHMTWMLFNLMISEMMWLFYFTSYLIINSSIMLMLNINNIYYINQMYNIKNFKFHKIILFLNFISISGLPPMFGFTMKWMSIYFMSLNKYFMMIMLMIMLSMLTFLFYMRIMLSFLLINSTKNKLMLMNKFKFNKINLFTSSFIINLWIMSIWIY